MHFNRGLRKLLPILEDSDLGIIKKENLEIIKKENLIMKAGNIEYKMPEAMAKEYLKNRKGEDAKMNPQAYLCKLVNEEFGLKGYCTKVIVG